MDPALFRNISLESNDNGRSGAELALAARRIINKDGEVVFNPDAAAVARYSLIPQLPATGPYIFGDELIEISQVADLLGAKPLAKQLSLLQLRRWVSGQFGIRFQSTGAAADLAQTRVLLQTNGASPTNPLLVYFDQLILTAFTGPGQFDLVERDVDRTFFDCITVNDSPLLTSVGDNFTADMVGATVTCAGVPGGTTVLSYQNPKQVTLSANADADVPAPGIRCIVGGQNEVIIATKAGFTGGDTTGTWSRLVKAITSDKLYSVIFVPGTAGDGIYSMNMSGLNQGQS